MASLSNINGLFDVHSTGAILFSTSHGTSGQILKSNGNAAPTWVDASTVIGGPYLPLSGGTLTGATATASGISFTVGGDLTVGDDINISGEQLTFTNDSASAYIRGADALLIQSDYNGGENKPIYLQPSAVTELQIATGLSSFTGNVVVGGATIDAAGSVSFKNNGFIRSVLASGSADSTLINGISGVSNGFQLINDASNNQSYIFHNGSTASLKIDTNGYVGIGDTSPDYRLTVAKVNAATPAFMVSGAYYGGPRIQTYGLDADSNAWMGLGTDMSGGAYEHNIYFSDYNGNGRLSIGTYNGTTYSEKMCVLRNGNVGIAKTVPNAPLVVYRTGDVWHTIIGNDTGQLRIGGQTGAGAVIQSRTESGTARDLYIQRDGGNVAIGTNIAGATLDVDDDNTGKIRLLRNGSTRVELSNNANEGELSLYRSSTVKTVYISSYYNSYFNGGNVGIKTTNPLYDLQIGENGVAGSYNMMIEGAFASTALASNPRLNLIDTNFGITAGKYGSGGADDALGIFAYQGAGRGILFAHTTAGSSTTLQNMRHDMFIDGGTGNVGIGQTSTPYKLTVGAATNNWMARFENVNSENVAVFLANASGYGMAIDSSENDSKYLLKLAGGTGGGTGRGSQIRMIVESSGNVGISNSAPKTKLHIGPLSGGDGTAQERLRLSGDYNGGGSGALLRFTNQHNSGSNPNSGEYNLGGIIAYDFRTDWGGALALQTAPNTSYGGTLVSRLIIEPEGNITISERVSIGTTTRYTGTQLNVDGNRMGVRTSNSSWGQLYVANPNDAEVGITFGAGGTGRPGGTSTYTRQWIMGLSPFGTGTTKFSLTNKTFAGNPAWTCTDTGLMGIRQVSPAYTLDVTGNVRVTDRLGVGTTPDTAVAGDRLKIQGGNNGLGCIKAISGQYSYGVRIEGSNLSTQLALYTSSTSQTTQINFEVAGNSSAGKITTTTNTTTYTTSSDYRLKENIVPISDSISRLNQLKPSRFNFIGESNKTVDGFIAHEVQDIVPEAVVGEKDEVNENGGIISQGIDQSKLVPLLVAAVQELEARVKELENK